MSVAGAPGRTSVNTWAPGCKLIIARPIGLKIDKLGISSHGVFSDMANLE